MTTIVPDQANAEGKKLAAYQPGDTVEIEFEVSENVDGQLSVEVTRCDLVAGEGEAGDEGYDEAAEGEMPAGKPTKGMPHAIVIALGRGK